MKRHCLSFLLLFMVIGEAAVATNAISDFLKDENGKIITNVYHQQATDACAALGMRLPTARELALEGVKSGAALLEVSDYDAGNFPTGYAKNDFYSVTTKQADGSKDSFYYSTKKYTKPDGDMGDYWTWSSSLHATFYGVAIYFGGDYGDLVMASVYYSDRIGGVRCAPVTAG